MKIGALVALAAASLLGIGAASAFGHDAPRGPRSPHDIYVPPRRKPKKPKDVPPPNDNRAKVKASRKANKKRRNP